ncbi:MAG: leucine-rich repeat protein [Firmicutes bacterium]|nr:leucine-rich repeat protein [Bacillota bacterium]
MKRACIVFLLALMLTLGLSAAAMAYTYIVDSGTCGADGDNLTWTLDNAGTLTISGTGAMAEYSFYNSAPWDSSATVLVIGNGVTSVGSVAFYYCSRLTSVTIPDSVTSIGDYAFSGCSNLTNVTIPDSVTSIGEGAFQNCNGLTSVNIPDSVTSIGNYAFCKCSGLTSLTIPDSVTSIGNYAFCNCSGLTSLTIPDSVTSIGDYALSGCRSLTTVTLGNGLTNIPVGMFGEYDAHGTKFACDKLTSITIPNSVTSIGARAFYGCKRLTSLTIPDSVISIGDSAFAYCSGLTSLTIPDSVTSIGNSAFLYCNSLTSLSIPDSVTSIGNSAFASCGGLTSLSIPNSVTNLGGSAFSGCTSLTTIVLPGSLGTIAASAFDGCTGLTGVTMANGVTAVGDSAFADCAALTSVTIPASVTSIGNWAFTGCSALTDVHYKGAPAQWNAVSIGSDNEPLLNAALHFGLEITSQPSDFTGKAGSTVRFTVGASGDGLTYQWYFKRPGETSFNKSTVAAATKKTFTMTMQDKYDGYQYYCLVKDSHGGSVRSDTVTIHKAAVLAVATQPADYYGPVGSTIKFTVSATGDGLTYQWYYKKAGETAFNKSTLSSATKKTFSMTMADHHDGWQYYCIVTDAYGDTVQSDTVTVHKVAPLSITSQPVAYSGTAGSLVKFTVTASGEGLTYQWYFKKTGASSFAKSTLASGTKAEYSMTLQDKHDGWQYYCLVKDAYGNSVKTDTVSIHVITPLDITALPQNFTGPVGSTAELDIEAEGEGLTYQWYYKTSALSAFTKSTTASGKSAHYRLKLAARHDGWKFYCVVSDAYGNKLRSNTVIVHVSAANELCIIKQPADFNGAIGQTANFTVKAAGEGLTYQWYYKTPMATKFSKCTSASGTTPTYSITVNTKHPGYKYYCIVKDAAGNSLRTNTVTIYITE